MDKNFLLEQAHKIKEATKPGYITAPRLGTYFEDIIEYFSEKDILFNDIYFINPEGDNIKASKNKGIPFQDLSFILENINPNNKPFVIFTPGVYNLDESDITNVGIFLLPGAELIFNNSLNLDYIKISGGGTVSVMGDLNLKNFCIIESESLIVKGNLNINNISSSYIKLNVSYINVKTNFNIIDLLSSKIHIKSEVLQIENYFYIDNINSSEINIDILYNIIIKKLILSEILDSSVYFISVLNPYIDIKLIELNQKIHKIYFKNIKFLPDFKFNFINHSPSTEPSVEFIDCILFKENNNGVSEYLISDYPYFKLGNKILTYLNNDPDFEQKFENRDIDLPPNIILNYKNQIWVGNKQISTI